jgi:flavin-dependent dehydrogenase
MAPDGYQGNWIPHELRPAVEDGVFFAGDSAGHCLPLTAEGIRTALYFGIACGRELSAVLDGERTREQALARYGAFSNSHERKYRWLLGVQRGVGQLTPSRAVTTMVRAVEQPRLSSWLFKHYLAIAPPSFVGSGAPARRPRAARLADTLAS